jgi:glycosyltransferase involved in cell wall biosynthesis
LELESSLIRKREIQSLDYFDINLLISEQEHNFLKELTGKSNIYQINPLLNNSASKFSRKYQGTPTFVFLGDLNIPHNETALLNFISSQMISIIKLMPDFKLKVIGDGANPRILSTAANYEDHIFLEGFVEDLEAVFNESCAMIIPLIFGSGLKIKTLEALSKGLPVISTDFGVEGISIRKGIECIVENDLDLWPDIMHELTDENINAEMSYTAYSFFRKHYSKEAIYKQYKNFFT